MNFTEQIKQLAENSEFAADERKVFEIVNSGLQKKEMPFSDLISFVLHYLVAIRLYSNPNLIEKAKATLKKWLKSKNRSMARMETNFRE